MPDPFDPAKPATPPVDPFAGAKRVWSWVKFASVLGAGALAMHAANGTGLTGPAAAAKSVPKAVISGPTTAVAGELISLDGSTSERGEVFRWLVAPDQAGKTLFETFDNGRRARISTLPGTRQFTLAVANANGIDLATHTITIPPGGGNPSTPVNPSPDPGPVRPNPPGPGPSPSPVVPTPDPTPQFPPGKFGLAAKVYGWATTKVVTPTRAAEAQLFADASESLAAELSAGKISGITRYDLASHVQRAIAERNAKLPPDVIASWKAFAAAFNTEVNSLFSAVRLTSADDWAHLAREMSAGLRAVK